MFRASFRPLLALALAVLCLTLLLHTSQSAATPAGAGPDQTATIHVNTGGQPTPIDGRVLGSNLPGAVGRRTSVAMYRIAQKLYKFS